MSIYNILEDYGEFDYASGFNGKLSDYVNEREDAFNETFKKIAEINDEIYIYRNFEMRINHQLISNKKIDYRDLNKIPESWPRVPYILYWKNDEIQRGIIINTDSYEEARGMYYCMTEPESAFEESRSEVLATYLNEENGDELINVVLKLQDVKTTAGAMQKKLDSSHFSDEEEMRDNCVEIASKMFDETMTEAAELNKQEKTELIYHTVVRAFLLKKGLYVKYMTNRKLLNERHDGNPVEQRKFAKAYTDEITIVPYFNLWNGKKEEEE